MHPKYQQAHALSAQVIGAAIEVHRVLGPGLLESVYERCLVHELELRGIKAVSQVVVPIKYKGLVFEQPLRLDVYAADCLIIENKAAEAVLPIHKATVLSYMKLMDVPLGLIINYHEPLLKNGITRLILPGADQL